MVNRSSLLTVLVAVLACGGIVSHGACSKPPAVRCGEGTELVDGECRPSPSAPSVTPIVAPLAEKAAAPSAAVQVPEPSAEPPAPAPPPSRWRYSSSEDKMRDARSEFASNVSLNSNDLGAPYGHAELRLVLRKGPKFGNDVMLQLSAGQFQCGSMSGCSVSMKFDGDKVRRYRASESSSPLDPVLFINDAAGVVGKLKSATKVIVEVETFTSGAEQYELDVAGLDWTLYKGPVLRE